MRYIVVLFLVAFVAVKVYGAEEEEVVGDFYQDAQVVDVVDGDTFKAIINGEEETIRLLMVDTPETVHPQKPVEPFGQEASNYLYSRLNGREVDLEFDKEMYDQYDRILAYVYVGNEMINESLLKEGYAEVKAYEPNDKYESEFRGLEKEAQENMVGRWN